MEPLLLCCALPFLLTIAALALSSLMHDRPTQSPDAQFRGRIDGVPVDYDGHDLRLSVIIEIDDGNENDIQGDLRKLMQEQVEVTVRRIE